MAERQASGDKLLMKGFGERLRSLRKAYADEYGAEHHTKTQWAKRLWVSPAMYGRWEAGANLPKFVDLLRISLLFRVDPNYLVAGVLSSRLEIWLHRALSRDNSELQDEVDYWQRQSVLFAQASRALGGAKPPSSRRSKSDAPAGDGEQSPSKASPTSLRVGSKRKTLARRN